ncbi:MAG: hypothetical protein Q8Q26_09180 [Pseudorhodobacter sp.]|nr:hypothetical protein [Pseudorhodobacter sp.]
MFFRRKKIAPPTLTLEGALGPNDRLDAAAALAVPAPEAMCVADSALLLSSGNDLLRLAKWGDVPNLWHSFDAPITALASSAGGPVAVGLGSGLAVLDANGRQMTWASAQVSSIADLLFLSEDELAVVDPGYRPDQPVLSLAPWDDVARGHVLGIRSSGEARQIASGLHCPMGIVAGGGTLLITELDRARVLDTDGKVRQAGYPAYLGRLRKTAKGYALACLSRRDPLIEFLKTEGEFVRLMKDTIAPHHWIAPRTTPEFTHDLPIALGATRLYGAIKPWAPSFSYGLVIELDADLMPIGSAHSRANGLRHAITDVCEWNGDLIAISRASGEILNLGVL